MKSRPLTHLRVAGFTLIEVMITVAVIAILAAVALPNYFDYVTRSRLVEAKTNLADMRTRLEQYFLDNRTYPTACIASAPGPPAPATSTCRRSPKFFTVTCTDADGHDLHGHRHRDRQHDRLRLHDRPGQHAHDDGRAGGLEHPQPNTCWVSRKSGEC